MKHIVKLRESDFHRLVRNIIMEDGLGGATSCAGVYDTAMSDGTYEGGEAQRKQVTDVPLGGVVRRPSVVGEPKGEKKDTLENDALKRKNGVGGSISVNQVESVERGEINEVNWKNLAMSGVLGAASMFGGPSANAQNYQHQQDGTQQSIQAGQKKPAHQRGTYWDLADDAVKPEKVTKESITPIMTNIRAVTANLTDYLEYVTRTLSRLDQNTRTEVEKSILTHCVKNMKTGKLVKTKGVTLDDASYIKRIYDTGDNLVTINVGGGSYFITVDALNETMQIFGLQKGSDNLIKTFKSHR